MRNRLFLTLGLVVLVGALFLYGNMGGGGATADGKRQVTLYKSPLCGCCGQYVAYLERNGFEVTTVNTSDMDAIKRQYTIPADLQSCHTVVADEYVIEGHMPVEAVNKLLAERPTIAGIALPGMPSGSPGMPGGKQGAWQVHALGDADHSLFMEL